MRSVGLIGVDWGTTSLRVYGMDRAGQVLEVLEEPRGIMSMDSAHFERTLEDLLSRRPGLDRRVPIVVSGMITSKQGWVETPYLCCPAGLSQLAAGLTSFDSAELGPIWFVPGLQYRHPDGVYDVMRGEETQILGSRLGSGWLVLPGTHVKWVQVDGLEITGFSTYMTGEVFAALRNHTILGRLMRGTGISEAAFERGLQYGCSNDHTSGGLLRRLFSTRTHGLFGNLAAEELHGYLSGLLIGCELREATEASADLLPGTLVTLAGNGALVNRYEKALEFLGYRTRREDESVVAVGHFRLAREAGLIA